MVMEAVLFDLDGTLVDSLPLIFRTYRQVFADMGIPWNESAVEKMIGLPLKEIGKHFTGRDEPGFEELYQTYYQRDHDIFTRLFPGTLQMLQNLEKHKIKLGIVTSKGRSGTAKTVAFTGLDQFMNIIVTAHDVLKHKPDPEPLLNAVEFLGVKAARTIFVGDSRFDILTGRNAGARTLGVTWGLGSREELECLQPDGMIDRWEELIEYIN
jgi:pyrophosphatase PpaX